MLTRRNFLQIAGVATASNFLNGCATNPVTGKRELLLMSQAQEVAIDRQQAAHQFSADYGAIQNKEIAAYIANVGSEIATKTHRPDMPYSFTGVNAVYINAYAFPGGTIGITRGILLKMQSEAELSALIGHELGHVSARHTAQRLSRGMLANIAMVGLAIAIENNQTRELVSGLGAIGAGALLATYSRSQEREADSLGLEYSVKSGYSPQGFIDLMAMLNQLSMGDDRSQIDLLFSSHPMSKERYETAITEVRTGSYDTTRPIHKERYMDNLAPIISLEPAIIAMQQGDKLMQENKPLAALEHYNQATKLAPQDYTAWMLVAKCNLALKNKELAAKQVAKANAIYPHEPQGNHLTGYIALAQKDYPQALQAFDKYEKLLPGNPNNLFLQGYTYEGLNERQSAAAKYHQFLRNGGSGDYAKHAQTRLQQWKL